MQDILKTCFPWFCATLYMKGKDHNLENVEVMYLVGR